MRATLSVKVILADRDLVEQGAEEILESAREKEVARSDYPGKCREFPCRWPFWLLAILLVRPHTPI